VTTHMSVTPAEAMFIVLLVSQCLESNRVQCTHLTSPPKPSSQHHISDKKHPVSLTITNITNHI
jgi:hypothetical protein